MGYVGYMAKNYHLSKADKNMIKQCSAAHIINSSGTSGNNIVRPESGVTKIVDITLKNVGSTTLFNAVFIK